MTSSQRPQFILVTGASGVVGHRVLDEVLKDGYKVRATCRPAKAATFRSTYPEAGDKLEIFEMEDMVTGDWSEALKGVDAVIHVAALVFYAGVTSQQIYDSAVTGTRRILEAVRTSSSVKRMVVTGTNGVFFKLDMSNLFEDVTFDENTWSDVEDIDPTKADPVTTYSAAKIISEKLVWEAAAKSPEIDFTVIMPCCTYGKFLDTYPYPKNEDELKINAFFYHFIKPDAPFPPFPITAQSNSKDVARAHVRALTAPPLTDGRKKRLIVCQDDMPWDQVIAHLREKRPEIKDRLPSEEKVKESLSRPGAQSTFKLDRSLTEEVLGFKMSECIPWQDTALEVMDWVLEWERKNGLSPA